MPVTLRKRLQCHYCGKRLNRAQRKGNRIRCEECLADNFFDENNAIIDVPATEAARAAGPSQPAEVESESSIFCKTCLSNQSFYVRALADYLPDEDDPRYQECEDALPTFTNELDLRYPRCCAQCEPRVKAQIDQANYEAKTDHLRRMVHRNHRRRRPSPLDPRSLLISAAGSGHLLSLAVQLSWHALASQAQPEQVMRGMTPSQCLRQWPVPSQCADYLASLMPIALAIGLLCLWWNPYWQSRLQGREGRLIGLRQYYMVQLGILVLRFTLWAFIGEIPVPAQHAPVIHVLGLVVMAMCSLYAWLTTIHVDTAPLVDWSQVHRPMVDPNQFQPPSRPPPQPKSSQQPSQPLLEGFAGGPRQNYEAWRPPTPPGSADSMDWAPTGHVFHPQPRQPRPKFDQPSPFHGNLPAAPVRGSLNPKQPASPAQKQALGIAPGFFGLSKPRDVPQPVSPLPTAAPFAPAKFFAHEREADTGLENIFDKMFSVRDPLEPPPLRSSATSQARSRTDLFGQPSPAPVRQDVRRRSRSSAQNPLRLGISWAVIVALAVITSSLVSLELLYPDTTLAPSTALTYTPSIPIIHVLEELICFQRVLPGRATISAIEITVAAASYRLMPASGSYLVPVWNKLVIGWMCLLTLQEIYHVCQLQSTPVSHAATAQMIQSMERAEREQLDQAVELSAPPHSSPPPIQSSQPTQTQHNPTSSLFNEFSTIRKRDSDESISSVSSIQTTSTASDWKTPQPLSRTYDWQNANSGRNTARRPSTNISRGLGGLSLGNDFGTGAGIAGPRHTQAQGSGLGRYR